jgi:lipid II:glycine glycyltransferase (peptidoglycan interpeptide bridge formation enzyme)
MHSLRSPRIKLWLARVNGRVAAGALCFSHARHAVYWHGASRAESQRSRAANLLHAHIVEDACARGLWWYDFNPSTGLAGVEAFKKSFGAVRRDCSTVVNQNVRRRALEFLKRPSRIRKLLG